MKNIVPHIMTNSHNMHNITQYYSKNYSINEVVEMFGNEKVYIDKIPGETRETLRTNDNAINVLKWNPKIDLRKWVKEQL